jgi:1-phosphofructokinase family hexose kinase
MIYTVTLNTAIDRIVQVYGTLTRKHNNKTKEIKFDIGGKATHVSVALSAMGIKNRATGVVGGENGQRMVDMMSQKGVECCFIEQADVETRESIIVVDESGLGSYMITQKGFPLSYVSIKLLKEYLITNVKENDIVVFAGSPPHELSSEIYFDCLKVAKDKNAKLIIDASGEYLHKALELNPYLIKPNEFEFQEFLNIKLNTIDEFVIALRNLEIKVDVVVVSLGKRGALAKYKNEIYHVIPPQIKEINETGAGDFFVAGLVAKIFEDSSTSDMLKFAAAVGASKAMQDESSSFSLDDVNHLINECKIERKY